MSKGMGTRRVNAIFSKVWHCSDSPVCAGPTQDERGKSGNMDFRILGVLLLLLLSLNTFTMGWAIEMVQ